MTALPHAIGSPIRDSDIPFTNTVGEPLARTLLWHSLPQQLWQNTFPSNKKLWASWSTSISYTDIGVSSVMCFKDFIFINIFILKNVHHGTAIPMDSNTEEEYQHMNYLYHYRQLIRNCKHKNRANIQDAVDDINMKLNSDTFTDSLERLKELSLIPISYKLKYETFIKYRDCP